MNHLFDKNAARIQMNEWGREGRPFFFLIDFGMKQPMVFPLDSLSDEGICCALPNFSTSENLEPDFDTPFHLISQGYPKDSYQRQFEKAVSEIRAGNSFLMNLTCETSVRLSVDLSELYHRVQAKYKLLFRNHFLVFSPETFVQIRDGMIYSYPMKGTIDATLPDAAKMLLEDPKEKAEHCTIVDLIRNDLSMVANEVRVNIRIGMVCRNY